MDISFLSFVVFCFILTITPGADMALVTKNTLAYSKRGGVLTAIGICTGLLLYGFLTASGLAYLLVHVVRVRHRADTGHALRPHDTQFTRRQLDLRIARILADQLRVGASRAGHLATGTDLQLDIVDDGADRHRRKRHCVARLDVDPRAGDHLIAHLQSLRRQDISQLAILVLDQRDEGGAVGIVFQPLHGRRHVELPAFEVDHAV